MLAVLVFFGQPNWDWARGILAGTLSGRMHRPVHIDGHVRVMLFSASPRIILTGFRIGEPPSGMPDAPRMDLATVDSLVAEPEILPLLGGQLRLKRLEVQKPVIVMFQDGAGNSNWDFSNGRDKQGASKLPPIRTLVVRDGHVSVTMQKRRLIVSGPVTAGVRSGFRFDGKGTQDGKPCIVTVTGPQLGNRKPYPFHIDLVSGATRIAADGRFLQPFNFGQLAADMRLQGASLSDLYYLLSITAPNTPAFDLSVHVDRNQKLYRVSRLSGHIGGSDLEGTMTIDRRGDRPMVTGDFSSRVLDLAGLGSIVGASRANTPHRPRMTMAPQMSGGGGRMMPDAQLDVERLRSADARVQYRATSVKAGPGVPVRSVGFTAALNRGVLHFDPVVVGLARGQATGTVVIDASGPLQRETVDLKLSGLRLEEFGAKGREPPLEGPLTMRVHATGTGRSVHAAASSADGALRIVVPGGTIRQSLAEAMGVNASKSLFLLLAKDRHETDIRCAVADFRIRNGVMQAERIVLDTGVVLVNGTGSIDLRDERINLVFRGKPKKFRLIRINAPIVIGGHLTRPTFGISAGPAVVQGGLAAVVGSVLPFVTLDYGKDVDCGALIPGKG